MNKKQQLGKTVDQLTRLIFCANSSLIQLINMCYISPEEVYWLAPVQEGQQNVFEVDLSNETDLMKSIVFSYDAESQALVGIQVKIQNTQTKNEFDSLYSLASESSSTLLESQTFENKNTNNNVNFVVEIDTCISRIEMFQEINQKEQEGGQLLLHSSAGQQQIVLKQKQDQEKEEKKQSEQSLLEQKKQQQLQQQQLEAWNNNSPNLMQMNLRNKASKRIDEVAVVNEQTSIYIKEYLRLAEFQRLMPTGQDLSQLKGMDTYVEIMKNINKAISEQKKFKSHVNQYLEDAQLVLKGTVHNDSNIYTRLWKDFNTQNDAYTVGAKKYKEFIEQIRDDIKILQKLYDEGKTLSKQIKTFLINSQELMEQLIREYDGYKRYTDYKHLEENSRSRKSITEAIKQLTIEREGYSNCLNENQSQLKLLKSQKEFLEKQLEIFKEQLVSLEAKKSEGQDSLLKMNGAKERDTIFQANLKKITAQYQKEVETLNAQYVTRKQILLDQQTNIGKAELLETQNNKYKRVHYILILDESGSMDGKPWEAVQLSVQEFLKPHQAIDSKHHITIITFGTEAREYAVKKRGCDIAPLGKIKGGGTSFLAPMKMLEDQLEITDPDYIPICIFMTDGEATDRKLAVDKLRQLKKTYKTMMMFAIGFGDHFDRVMLQDICKVVNGSNVFTTRNQNHSYIHYAHNADKLNVAFSLISQSLDSSGVQCQLDMIRIQINDLEKLKEEQTLKIKTNEQKDIESETALNKKLLECQLDPKKLEEEQASKNKIIDERKKEISGQADWNQERLSTLQREIDKLAGENKVITVKFQKVKNDITEQEEILNSPEEMKKITEALKEAEKKLKESQEIYGFKNKSDFIRFNDLQNSLVSCSSDLIKPLNTFLQIIQFHMTSNRNLIMTLKNIVEDDGQGEEDADDGIQVEMQTFYMDQFLLRIKKKWASLNIQTSDLLQAIFIILKKECEADEDYETKRILLQALGQHLNVFKILASTDTWIEKKGAKLMCKRIMPKQAKKRRDSKKKKTTKKTKKGKGDSESSSSSSESSSDSDTGTKVTEIDIPVRSFPGSIDEIEKILEDLESQLEFLKTESRTERKKHKDLQKKEERQKNKELLKKEVRFYKMLLDKDKLEYAVEDVLLLIWKTFKDLYLKMIAQNVSQECAANFREIQGHLKPQSENMAQVSRMFAIDTQQKWDEFQQEAKQNNDLQTATKAIAQQ